MKRIFKRVSKPGKLPRFPQADKWSACIDDLAAKMAIDDGMEFCGQECYLEKAEAVMYAEEQ